MNPDQSIRYVCGGCGAHLDGLGVAHSCEAETVRLRSEIERLRRALRVCREAFRTINASNGATRLAESVIASALDETDRRTHGD